MYLKSIEVHGFKAFANKIRFEFNKGITGIVGPNGSGKSNVADAVRWVLGEQSAKQLRGSSMQDVIFSGTELRKPMGYAYVALTLDNSDHWLPIEYEEVTVGRRVYRSGESEYLINGAECRLRDVQELFFDTGVGKEGYSIIGQGQIDKILSGKPEERRELFDEAAGITKVKRRKSMTEKNLEIERQNLSRVTDILNEIENRLQPLERQYEKAKVYLKYRDELKVMEVNQFLLEYEKSASIKSEMDEKLSIANRDLSQAKVDYEKAKEEYDRLLNQLEQYQEKLQTAKEQRNDMLVQAEKAAGEKNVYQEQIAAFKQNERQFEERLQHLQGQADERRTQLAECEHKQNENETQLKGLLEEQKKAEAQLGEMKVRLQQMMEEARICNESHIACLNDNTRLQTELERNNTLAEQSAIAKAELNAKLLRYKTEADQAKQQVEDAEAALKEAADHVIACRENNEQLDALIQSLTQQIRTQETEYDRQKQAVIQNTSKYDSLKNLVERYDGYGSAVRGVMEQKKTTPGIHGVVADIIQVESRYETAIETALGGNIQNIVTDTTDTAKKLITYLKENRMGRATFLPLSSIRAKKDEFDSAVFTKKGVIGVASSLVEAEPVFSEAVRYLLGRFLVVDTIDHALQIEKQYQQSLRIVTLDGELFQPGGAVSGGAYKNNSNLLGKRRELETLEERIRQARAKEQEAAEKQAALRKEREEKRQLLENGRTTLQEGYVALNTAKMNLNHIKEQTKDLLGSREDLQNELKRSEEQFEGLQAEQKRLQQQIAENSEKSQQQKDRAEAIQGEMEQARNAEDDVSAEAVRVLTECSGLKQNIEYRQETMKRFRQEIVNLEQEMQKLRESRSGSDAELNEKLAHIAELEADMLHLQEEEQKLAAEIDKLSGLADEITKQNKGFFEKRENLSALISKLDKEVYRLNSQQEKMAEQLEAQTRYMWDEYELTYSSAKELRSEEIDNPTLNRKQIYEMKNKIRALGDVNVNAIEEYKETKERYEFLSGQKKDIQDAEASLAHIITSLDEEMRKRFKDTFGEIQVRFNHVFRELFGGGKGTITLTEGEDVLEAGIHIIAQPPGKKLQNMMQLSGGEKALTAISLLFAILDLKPSPFCLLDEIEAALDDSNVNRFAQYLHKLTKDTQFIVITHRRGTMAAADALYGITMQEKGVSTLVSVNLIEKDLDA